MSNVFERRREYVNRKFAEKVSNTNMSNSKKTRLLKKLWREARRKIS